MPFLSFIEPIFLFQKLDWLHYEKLQNGKTAFFLWLLTQRHEQTIHFCYRTGARWPFCLRLRQTNSQCLGGEGVAVSPVEWILPLSLENRAVRKQTAVRARRSPSEWHRTIAEESHTCASWSGQESGGGVIRPPFNYTPGCL